MVMRQEVNGVILNRIVPFLLICSSEKPECVRDIVWPCKIREIFAATNHPRYAWNIAKDRLKCIVELVNDLRVVFSKWKSGRRFDIRRLSNAPCIALGLDNPLHC